MLSGRIRRRALALLGALLLVILVWPPCCATMPKPLPAVLPMAPWEIVPPSRPHPAAAVLPVQLAYPHGYVAGTGPHGAHLKRHGSSAAQPAQAEGERTHRETSEQQQKQHQQQEPPESGEGSRQKSRQEGELYRFMRVLKRSVEPNERRTQLAVSETRGAAQGSGQLNIPARENSPPRPHDYSIESIDKNKSRTTRTVPQLVGGSDKADAGRERAEFDDTVSAAAASSQPSSPVALSRSRRSSAATAASGNPHRHQHKMPSTTEQQLNATAGGVWHGRRGGGGRQQQQQLFRNNDPNLERNERSANLSHISGATRKIQLFIKNRYVQLLPDGTVNGTHDDLSDYIITVDAGPVPRGAEIGECTWNTSGIAA
uniref:Uncharacterized protein n=1 Tax=Anopheles atroparvus TaxID=41427 RepID=A0A182INJ5_ANOAO